MLLLLTYVWGSAAALAVTATFDSSNFNRGQQYTNAPFVSGSGGVAPYTYSVTGGTVPTGYTFNADGTLTGYTCDPNGSYGQYRLTVTDANNATASTTATFNVNRAPPGGCNITLPTNYSPNNGTVGTAYTGNITATGTVGTVTYSVLSGSLPPGTSLNTATGAVTGNPTTAGSYTFTVFVSDTGGGTGGATYSITIGNSNQIAITTTSLPNPVFGRPYSQTINTAGALGTVVFQLAGSLPPGLTLNAATGVITGSTTQPGPYNFSVMAIDLAGNSTDAKNYTVTVADPPIISVFMLPTPVIGQPYNRPLNVLGGAAPVTCAVTSGALPAGLSLDASSCTISGTATAPGGAYSFTVTATDANGLTDVKSYSGTIAAPIAITTLTLPAPVLTQSYNQTVAATGGTAPVTFTVTGGTLPLGLTLNPNTGAITGTPTTPGPYSFTVTATDANNVTDAKTYSGTISPALAITTPTLPNPTAGAPYSQPVNTSGGRAPVTCAITAGALPAGLTLNTATCTISGTATTPGPYAFTVTATDADGQTASQNYAGNVAGAVAITTRTLPDPTAGAPYNQVIAVDGGLAPTTCAVTSGALPAGLTLNTSTCTISGTPTQPGPYAFTITATDANNSSSSQNFAGIVRATTAVALTASAATVTMGQPVTFTARVTGFQPAGTVSFYDGGVLLGTGTVAGGVATLTVSNLRIGTHNVVANYSGDANNLPASSNTLALAVNRPDPSQDPNVRGIVAAQARTALRFAATQMNNVQQRMENMHGEDDGDGCSQDQQRAGARSDVCINFVNGIRPTSAPRAQSQENLETLREASLPPAMRSSTTLAAQTQAQSSQAAFGALSDFDKPDANGRRTFVSALSNGSASSNGASANGVETTANAGAVKAVPLSNKAQLSPWTINVWTAGSIATGRYTADGRTVEDKFTSSGLTFGVDTRIMPGLKAGLALGFARDKTDIGTDGTVVKGTSVSGTAYASYRVFGNVFVDGLVGYGHATFKSSRWSAPYGEWYEGERKAKTLFESIALTSEYRYGQLLIAPYIRADFIQVQLDRYSETGGAGALTFDKARVNSVDGVLGLRGRYDFVTSWGTVGPTARIELHRLLTGSFTQTLAYTVDPGLLYSIVDNGQTKWGTSGALGLQATGKGGLSGGIEFMFATTGSQMNARGLRANIKASF